MGAIKADDDAEKSSRGHFMVAAKNFDAASRAESLEEQAIKAELASAMTSPAILGKPSRQVLETGFKCQPDLMRCPKSWNKRGVLCYASSSYTGPCAPQAELLSMSAEQKLAFARICQVEFE